MSEHNKKLKNILNETLKRSSIEICGKTVSLLTRNTKQIVIYCNDGNVSDVSPVYRTK